jgi:hypothetical protein
MDRGASDYLHITAANFVGQRTVEFINHLSGPRGVGMFAAELESGVISADGFKVEVKLANGEHVGRFLSFNSSYILIIPKNHAIVKSTKSEQNQ